MTSHDMTDIKQWAISFKEHHNCNTCPFVRCEVDIGVGMIRDCDNVCWMEVDEIMQEMEGYGV